ncbi:hypothetical protein CK203_015830 [Vitis vinifera]|uniref:Uncharacterized protein n=1 Tax=Vitis vinifera TaxID=29760 RepID=A0A438JR47_VITVI|nr:hypothetical protein CK203_015830 [Vitis vinifera]
MEHLLAPRTFSIPGSHGFLPIHDNQRVRNPTLIHFTMMETCIGPKEGESLRSSLQDVRRILLWASSSDHGSLLYLREGSQEEASKSRLHSPPLPKAAMPNFGASGIPSEPQLERKRICREPFTLDKWNNMTPTN